MTRRLSTATLARLRPGVQRFTYDRQRVTAGIVHLGIGAFHRAHQAVVVDDVLASDPGWGIVGASLRRADTRQALAPQDGLYSVLVRDGSESRARIIGSVLEVIDAPADKAPLLRRMTDPATRIVSLTVTEKGYCYNATTGHLDGTHPEIVADLAHPGDPTTAPGLIVEALRLRRLAGLPPFTVLSCDNLPHNGQVTAQVVGDFAAAVDPALGRWVSTEVAFPGTMIDRIVPATTEADRQEAADLIGLSDAWPVVAEPFLQWVIEDRFSAGRPALEIGGAQFVSDVAPYETMKLRMLNGAHSMLAYLGYLQGHEFMAQVIGDARLRAFIEAAWRDEIAPTLAMPASASSAYAAALLQRFSNPALRHRTYQIAMDGSQKLPQRLVATIADRLRRGLPINRLALGIAAWIAYARGVDLKGQPIPVQDPMRDAFSAASAAAGDDAEAMVANFLVLPRVFSEDVRRSEPFRSAVLAQYRLLLADGPSGVAGRLG